MAGPASQGGDCLLQAAPEPGGIGPAGLVLEGGGPELFGVYGAADARGILERPLVFETRRWLADRKGSDDRR
jgi:hypothetical protein